ncbi:flavin monoamine oxidase family protein [Methylobacterium soli]|uniref:FAD-dependent oxidoreductase n=1 Tax=Methylobacterium soli TaxID=553447 RepID=A0A6L3T4W1_9HYPH|nr:NAD(P)/FAD-dependent oxidoreductase [Methylobacterium soli]KAB1080287.1 FAD-dependent oxidoreductase [Methylobacterium soli]GJE44739.1 Pseudooxynicotine oxidase [Methylobacterium soli]
MTEHQEFDAVVLGAGFAGIAAARELKRQGRKVVVLEARDRIGGRAWTSRLGSHKVEMGATWIHWFQPYIWAEFIRAGLTLHEDPWLPPITIWVDGKPQGIAFERFRQILQDCWSVFAQDGETGHRMELPYDLDSLDGAAALDDLSVQDVIDGMNLTPVERVAFRAEISVQMNALPEDVSFLSQLRWWSASGWQIGLMIDCLARYKVEEGVSRLIEIMAERAGLDIRLDSPVARVDQTGDRVVVTTRDGRTFTAGRVVTALPMNCIKNVAFAPPLSEAKMALSHEEHAAKGMKVLFQTEGEPTGHAIVAEPDAPLNLINPIRIEGETRIYVGFGADGQAFDPTDLDAVNRVLSDLHPDLKAVAATGHDWSTDAFSLGTWHMPRPGQNLRVAQAFAEPEGRVFFAGDYLAKGWVGFMDGAIESGLLTADRVEESLRADAA